MRAPERRARLSVHVAAEVFGARRKILRHHLDETLARHRLERVIGRALASDGGAAVGADITAAHRPGAVRGIDLDGIGQGEQLAVQAVVELTGELLRRDASPARSGRPTSPMKSVSPVSTATGSEPRSASCTTMLTLSGVCPGVWRNSRRQRPNAMVSPSRTARCGNVAPEPSPR